MTAHKKTKLREIMQCIEWCAQNGSELIISPGEAKVLLEVREIKLPPTIWHASDGKSQKIAVLEKRLVEKTLGESGIKIVAGVKVYRKGSS